MWTVSKIVKSNFACSSASGRRKWSCRQRSIMSSEHLIDRILIFAGPGGDLATHLFAKAVQEGGGAQVRRMGRGIGKQALQVRIVQGRACRPIVLALACVVLAQGLLQLGQRIDLLTA